MKQMGITGTLALVAALGGFLESGALAAVDKLERVKSGRARETPRKELAEPIDGLQATSALDLKSHCASLKRERPIAEKELEERIRAARVADGSTVDLSNLPAIDKADIRNPPKPKDAKAAADSPEAKETKKAVAEAFVRRSTLACLLFATREIQDGRAKKKVPTTKELLKRCSEGKDLPDLSVLDCEGGEPAPAPKENADKK